MGQPEDERPLTGIRVLELTSGIAGPATGRHLSALGAEVIRLDSLKWLESTVARVAHWR
jgi:crotonobetainyl-CoA:carnitine CoA-transferase CaiB-like acyl-CoA transferase